MLRRRSKQENASGRASPLAGVGLTSFAALLLELALTRIFSVVFFYHYAFLAISSALLGLGAGGVFAYLRRSQLAQYNTRKLGSLLCAINGLAILAALEVTLHARVAMQLSAHNFVRLSAAYLASAVPFFLTGVLLSVVFAREATRIPLLYGVDLLGGALACLAVVPLLNWIGGPNTILFAGLIMAAASAVWACTERGRWPGLALTSSLAILITANYSGRLIDVTYAKGVRIANGVEYVRWNALSRVEVDQRPEGSSKWIVIDEDANSVMLNSEPHQPFAVDWAKLKIPFAPSAVTILRPHGDFAIIGPGGGVDVLRAVASGSPSVTGIEINPIIVNNIMRGRYADYVHHLYELPQVHIYVADGRSFIRQSQQKFDVVQMTLVDTWAATAAGAYSLSENNLYTVEAFREYFDHLKPDGLLAITRWEFKRPREALRVVSVALQALHEMGVANPAGNFVVLSEGALEEDGWPVLMLAKKSAFTPQEEATLHTSLAGTKLVAQYMPSAPNNNAFGWLIASNDPYGFARSYEFNIAPVTDNAPFFFFTLKTRQILSRHVLHRGMDWKVNLGVVVLGIVLLISIAAVALFLILPLALRGGGGVKLQLLYFVAVGLGYMLVEIAFIQRFVLFLGHPTYALTVVIFLLLLSSGVGSLVSRKYPTDSFRVRLPLAFIVIAIAAYVLLLPRVLTTLVGLPLIVKLGISGAMLMPLGFAMGMPFPTGLRWLARSVSGEHGTMPPATLEVAHTDNAVEWAWAVNAASSVLGSTSAMMIAVQFGFNFTLVLGAVAYLLALVLTATFRGAGLRAVETTFL
jgi:spermidine synthase